MSFVLHAHCIYITSYIYIHELSFIITFISFEAGDTISPASEQCHPYTSLHKVNVPDDGEINNFYDYLAQCGVKPVLLSLLPKYSEKYVHKTTLSKFPRPLQLLYHPKYMELDHQELFM